MLKSGRRAESRVEEGLQRKWGEDSAERGMMRAGSHGPWKLGEATREHPTAAPLRDSDKCCWTVLYLVNIAKFAFSTSDTKCVGFPHQAVFQFPADTS